MKRHGGARSSRRTSTGNGELRPLEDSVGFLVSVIDRQLKPLLDARLRRTGISYGMWYFLRVLWEGDNVTQRDLAKRVGMSAPSALEALRKLEQLRIIAFEPDAQDKRRVRIRLTRKGLRLKGALIPKIDELNTISLRGFSQNDVKLLRGFLKRIRSNTVRRLAG